MSDLHAEIFNPKITKAHDIDSNIKTIDIRAGGSPITLFFDDWEEVSDFAKQIKDAVTEEINKAEAEDEAKQANAR